MQLLFDSFVAIRDFLELGGPVLIAIAGVIFFMWILIFERTLFFRNVLRVRMRQALHAWEGLNETLRIGDVAVERRSWLAHQVREEFVSRFRFDANESLPLIRTMVALCPLLGLLGTVTGMIEVFDVLAISGTGNARSMATGVSKATIPTMAGMVGALTGLSAVTLLARTADREVERLEESLTFDRLEAE